VEGVNATYIQKLKTLHYITDLHLL